MKTLHLNLHKKWFDMIQSGEKKEEYRELTDYWKTRMNNVKKECVGTITFSNGYAKDRRQIVVELLYISIRKGLLEWGAEKDKVYFVIHLGRILKGIKLVPQSDIDKLEKARLQLYKMLEDTKYVYELPLGISDAMWQITHRKYTEL